MTTATTILRRVALAGLPLLLVHAPVMAADVDQVLTRMRQSVAPGTDMRANVEFIMTNAQGESVRWSGTLYRRSGPAGRMRITFDSPVDMRGTDVTVQRDADGTSHTRVYLPSIRRVRDITGDMHGESFLGTDFNYEDIGLQQIDFQQHALRGDDAAAGRSCYEVESVPARGWWCGKIVRCIDKKNYLPLRTDYYDRSGVLWKVRTFDQLKKIGPYPTATDITMKTVPTGTSTEVVLSNVAYDTGLKDGVFERP